MLDSFNTGPLKPHQVVRSVSHRLRSWKKYRGQSQRNLYSWAAALSLTGCRSNNSSPKGPRRCCKSTSQFGLEICKGQHLNGSKVAPLARFRTCHCEPSGYPHNYFYKCCALQDLFVPPLAQLRVLETQSLR